MQFFESLVGLVAVILIFGLPVIAVVCGFVMKMHKGKQEREIRQLPLSCRTSAPWVHS